jgi:hypothetical protein
MQAEGAPAQLPASLLHLHLVVYRAAPIPATTPGPCLLPPQNGLDLVSVQLQPIAQAPWPDT